MKGGDGNDGGGYPPVWADILFVVFCITVFVSLSGCQSPAAGKCVSLTCLKDQARAEKMRECISANVDQAMDLEAIGMHGATGRVIEACRKWSQRVVR